MLFHIQKNIYKICEDFNMIPLGKEFFTINLSCIYNIIALNVKVPYGSFSVI